MSNNVQGSQPPDHSSLQKPSKSRGARRKKVRFRDPSPQGKQDSFGHPGTHGASSAGGINTIPVGLSRSDQRGGQSLGAVLPVTLLINKDGIG